MTVETKDWKILAFRAVLCGVFLVAAIVLQKLAIVNLRVVYGFYILSITMGGWDAVSGARETLAKKSLDINFLMLAVVVGASVIGAWQEGAILLFLFSTSGALESYATNRMDREISALTKSSPKTARKFISETETKDCLVGELLLGDRIRVRPDEIFPVDARILHGETEVDESNITGESIPIVRNVGAEVHSGTLNLWGVVTLEVLRPVSESSLAKIIRMIHEAQENRAPSQRFTDRFDSRYVKGVLLFSLAMFFVWWLGFGLPPFRGTAVQQSAFYRSMAVLVVASPCALVLSIPSSILAGIAWGARHGILFRGGSAIEELAGITVVALDKTGTLTAGVMNVTGVETFPPGSESELLQITYSVEKDSNHPIARAITGHCVELGMEPTVVTELRSLTGKGIQANIAGNVVKIGRRELIKSSGYTNLFDRLDQDSLEKTEVWVMAPNLVGRILLEDQIRKESGSVMAALRQRGITTVMLTGDKRKVAESVAREIGIAEIHAGLHPEDKVAYISSMVHSGKKIAMVGDGVNDAPSLAAAHVSVSMGGRGSDAALEQADVVLMNDRIEKLESAIALSQKTRTIIRQNLIVSLATIIIMMALTIGWPVPLTFAVIVHESSTVLVCLNSLRILFFRE